MHPGRPSDTAILIARCTLLAAREPDRSGLVLPGTETLLAALPAVASGWLGFALRHAGTRAVLGVMEQLTLPGIITHYLARKRWLEIMTRRALDRGVTQIVVLGAGFDTLAWRLHREQPAVHFFELDHPATQAPKRATLGAGLNLSYLPVDLATDSPAAALHACPAFSPTKATLFIAEGLLMYFQENRVAALLRELAMLTRSPAEMLFTFMEQAPDGAISFRGEHAAVSWWLRWRREPFRWGITRAALPDFIQRCGLQLGALADHNVLRMQILTPLGLAGLPLASGECLCHCQNPQPINPGLLVNDTHAQLNATRVVRIEQPASTGEVGAAVREAAQAGLAVSLCGSRHAMGGQQFGEGTLLLDLRKLTQIGPVDRERGLIEAGAGVTWPVLIQELHRQQADGGPVWSIRQKQTGADNLTLGGALAANAHGRGLRMRPIIDDVEAFTLVDASGESRRCSRAENTALFRLVIGGYGCFGAVTSVGLRLSPRRKLERVVEVITLDRLMPALESRIAAGYLYGDFQFSIDERSRDFLHRGVFSCYRPVGAGRPMPAAHQELGVADWKRLTHLAHTDRAKAFEVYAGYYLTTNGQLYWSDTHQLSVYLDNYHEELDHELGASVKATEMITELYVPRARLAGFMIRAAEELRPRGVPVIYGTVRLIERDTESFLAWAREDYACVIFNLHTEHSLAGLTQAADAFRALIDAALAFGGSYFLTYHRWARRDQVAQAYPQFAEFLRHKAAHDPAHRFQSEWWRHYQKMFGAP